MDRRAGPCSTPCTARGRAARELYLSRGHPTQLKLLLPLSASSQGGGARDRKLRHPSAPTRAPSESLWSVKVLVCLPVGLACTLAARQMKRPKFQTTWETGFGASIASPRIGMISGGNRGPGVGSLFVPPLT